MFIRISQKIRLKDLLLNFSLSIISIYLPSVCTSYFLLTRSDVLWGKSYSREFYQNMRKQKISALIDGYLPPIYPEVIAGEQENLSFYPIGFLPNKKYYLCDEGYGLIKFKTDRFGFRNSDYKWDKISTANNIFVIGDSFVHGACIPKDANITSIIEDKLGINTLNLGMSSNSPYEYQATLKTLVKPILKNLNSENIVIQIFYSNDNLLFNSRREELLKLDIPIVEFSESKIAKPTDMYVNQMNEIFEKNYNYSKDEIIQKINSNKPSKFGYAEIIVNSFKLLPLKKRLAYLTKYIFSEINRNSISRRSIRALSTICKNNCKPIIVYIPRISSLDEDRANNDLYKLQLKNSSEFVGITFIDGEKVIKKNVKENYAPYGLHLSKEGYKKIASLIVDSLKK